MRGGFKTKRGGVCKYLYKVNKDRYLMKGHCFVVRERKNKPIKKILLLVSCF